jgi:DNA-binding transcriptional LysR family regulator
MELRHLRYFVAVAEEQNITRAAERLHVSQPPLSRQIRDLEDELGVELLERTAKAVKLTPAGRVFLGEARAVLQRAEEAVQAAREAALSELAELHVGYAPSPTVEILPPTLRAFREASPVIRVILHDMTSDEMLTGLRKEVLHVAMMVGHPPHQVPGLVCLPLRKYRVGVAVPPGHPFTLRSSVTPEEVIEEPLVVYSRKEYNDYHGWISRILGVTSKKLHIAEEVDGALSLIAAVEGGRGVAISSESLGCISGPRVVFIPFDPSPPEMQVVVACREDLQDAAVERFMKLAQKVAGEVPLRTAAPAVSPAPSRAAAAAATAPSRAARKRTPVAPP